MPRQIVDGLGDEPELGRREKRRDMLPDMTGCLNTARVVRIVLRRAGKI
jgi:hypothetical protein